MCSTWHSLFSLIKCEVERFVEWSLNVIELDEKSFENSSLSNLFFYCLLFFLPFPIPYPARAIYSYTPEQDGDHIGLIFTVYIYITQGAVVINNFQLCVFVWSSWHHVTRSVYSTMLAGILHIQVGENEWRQLRLQVLWVHCVLQSEGLFKFHQLCSSHTRYCQYGFVLFWTNESWGYVMSTIWALLLGCSQWINGGRCQLESAVCFLNTQQRTTHWWL